MNAETTVVCMASGKQLHDIEELLDMGGYACAYGTAPSTLAGKSSCLVLSRIHSPLVVNTAKGTSVILISSTVYSDNTFLINNLNLF
jgi:hypothetical protein